MRPRPRRMIRAPLAAPTPEIELERAFEPHGYPRTRFDRDLRAAQRAAYRRTAANQHRAFRGDIAEQRAGYVERFGLDVAVDARALGDLDRPRHRHVALDGALDAQAALAAHAAG